MVDPKPAGSSGLPVRVAVKDSTGEAKAYAARIVNLHIAFGFDRRFLPRAGTVDGKAVFLLDRDGVFEIQNGDGDRVYAHIRDGRPSRIDIKQAAALVAH